jgi:hypothetical protein
MDRRRRVAGALEQGQGAGTGQTGGGSAATPSCPRPPTGDPTRGIGQRSPESQLQPARSEAGHQHRCQEDDPED